MFSSWSKHINMISVAALLCACCFQGSAGAWQFRDVEDAPPKPMEDESSSQLIDLIPTNQEFSAPIVSAAGKREEPAPPKTIIKPPAVESAPKAQTSPKVERKSDPLPMTPEPVPMPELSAKKAEIKPSVVAQTKAALQDPLDVFKRGLESPKSTSNTYSATFKGVQAGSTTKTEVIDFWGKPARSVPFDDDSTTLIYKVPPFRQVDVAITANTVTGVLVHLTKPINANKVAKELELDEFVAVPQLHQ